MSEDAKIALSSVLCPPLVAGDLCILGPKKILAVLISVSLQGRNQYCTFLSAKSGNVFKLHKQYYNDCFLIASMREQSDVDNEISKQIMRLFKNI